MTQKAICWLYVHWLSLPHIPLRPPDYNTQPQSRPNQIFARQYNHNLHTTIADFITPVTSPNGTYTLRGLYRSIISPHQRVSNIIDGRLEYIRLFTNMQ